MDISNGRLGFTQDLDNQKFLNALRQSNRGVTDFNAHLQQNFNQSLISVNDLAKGVTAFLTIDMARDFVSQMVKIRGEFEQTEIAFNTMLQSREKGNALMQEMVELAKNTPMQFSEVSQGAKQLLAYQVEAEKLTETLSMLGDISSGLGVPMSRLILVYGQVRAKGRLMGDDLRQFTEAGVPMIAMIAKNMGVAQSAVADMVSEGKVGFKEVEKVLEQLTSQGGLFYNMMEEQSKTIPGQIAKLQDEIEQMFNNIGKDSQGFVTSVISGASAVVENYDSIGKTLGVLIGSYGAYKAALITVSAIESARAKTVYSELESLSRKDRVQLLLTERSVRHAQATLAEAQAEHVKNQAVLTTMRTDVSSLAIKKQKAITSAIEARNNVIEIQSKLANARAELTAIETTGTARQISIAQKKVERLENGLIDAQEKQSISRKAALGQTQAFNNAQLQLENQSKKTSISQTAVANAQDAVSVTTKNLNSAATARLTIFQNLQVVSTKAWTKAQAMLNATMLTNPYVLLTVAVIGLTAAITKMILQATYAEEIQDKLNETLSSHRQNVAATEAEIQTLVEAIKSENTTNEEKESLLKKIVRITDGKIQNLSVEKIKTGELDAQLQAYIQTLYKQAEAEAYLEDIKELTKKKAANNDRKNKIQKDGPGFWESAESLIDANSWKNGNYKEILRSDHDFGKTIIKNIDAENAAIDEAIKERKKLVTEKVVVDKEIIKEPSDVAGAVKDSKKKSTSTKKSDDPVEIYKKQVSEIEKQHERYLKILDSNDISFVTEKAILQSQLSSKGKTYEEYLRTQQKELSKTAETSEITRKKLSFVNDELLKLIDHSEVEIFKDNLDKQLDNADSIIEKLKIIDDIRNELSSNTNELTAPKIEFVDKTQLELIDQLDQKGKELVASLGGGYSQLQKLTNEYNNDILILTESLKNAKTEAEKTVINDSIWKRGVKFAEDSKDLPTNDDNYNKLLLEFKSFEQKKSDITLDFDNKISVAKLNNDKKLEEQLLQEKKKALSKIAFEQLKSSQSYIKLLGSLDKMSVKSLDKLLTEIKEKTKDNSVLGIELDEEDLKILLDQIEKLKGEISKKNPFKGMADAWKDFIKASTDDDNIDAIKNFLNASNSAFEATKEIMDMTTDAVEAFGGKLDDSAKQTIQSVQNIVNGIGNAIQGYFSGDWAQMIAGIVQVVVEVAKIIGGSKDRRLEKVLKKQQQAVNDLKRAYDDLSFAIDRALGGKNYSLQQDQIKNLQEQKILMEQMIKNEEAKKKTDKNKVNEWKNAIADIDRQIQEIQENIASDILQTTAKELANTLGDALAEAFSKGEDAAKSFEKVANDVLKNAVLNQLKKRFIEDQLQKALDQLQKDMGVDDKGWSGLTPEEQQAFRDKIKEIAEGFQGALEGYSELFSDLVDPNESSLAGAIKGVSEETASLIVGQVNAMRLLIVEANKTRIETNRILLQSLDRLANIDFNTKNANVILDKMYAFMQSNKDNNRSYGF